MLTRPQPKHELRSPGRGLDNHELVPAAGGEPDRMSLASRAGGPRACRRRPPRYVAAGGGALDYASYYAVVDMIRRSRTAQRGDFAANARSASPAR